MLARITDTPTVIGCFIPFQSLYASKFSIRKQVNHYVTSNHSWSFTQIKRTKHTHAVKTDMLNKIRFLIKITETTSHEGI